MTRPRTASLGLAAAAPGLPPGAPVSFAHPAGPAALLRAGDGVTAYADWFFSGFLSRGSGPAGVTLHVCEVTPAECEAIAAALPEPPQQAARLLAAGRAACVRDDAAGDVHLFTPRPAPGMPDPGPGTAVRVLRALVLRDFLDAGWGFLHAACVAIAGQGIALAGPRHAGKTTALLQCLHWLGPDAALVSNDKLAIDPAGQAAAGFPVRVGIRPGTLEALPAGPLRSSLIQRAVGADGRAHARPQDLAAAAGTEVAPLCQLRAAVTIELDPATDRPRLEEPPRWEQARLLASWALNGPAGVYPEQAEAAPTRGPGRDAVPDVSVWRLIMPPGDGRGAAALLAGLAG
jgi:hypothetical protein